MLDDVLYSGSETSGLLAALGRLSRYDLALAIIPLAFLLSLLAGRVLSASPSLVLAGGGVIGAAVLVDGLYLHPPRPGT